MSELQEEISELRLRLEKLELSTGEESTASKSPFAPRPLVFRKSVEDPDEGPVSTKLPSVDVPKFDGDVEEFHSQFSRWMRLSGVSKASDRVKFDWVIMASVPKYRKLLERICDEVSGWEEFWTSMEMLFPKV